MWQIVVGVIALLAIAYVILGIHVAKEYERGVVFTLGRYTGLKGPGLYWLAPIFQTQRKIDLRVTTVDIERQETITKDSVTVNVNAVVWYRVYEADKAVIEVKRFNDAVYQVALTSLRNIIGQHSLDEVLKERDKINEALKQMVDTATEPWGVKVEMVEMKDVEIPPQMQRAMAQEAQAIREARARVVKAQGEYDGAEKMAEAAQLISANPMALELRRMQMITEVGAEQNTTTIVMMPTEFVTVAEAAAKRLLGKGVAEGTGLDTE
jgi:regulator of protease activity HflC (stomatin/prohibitin superfamily)